MKKDKKEQLKILRENAMAAMAAMEKGKNKPILPLSENDYQKLTHELEVYQLELEMQNEQLNETIEIANKAVEEYSDLYKFAPFGYITLLSNGEIVKANHAAATLLEENISSLVGKRFALFFPQNYYRVFYDFIFRIFSGQTKVYCELAFINKENIEKTLFLEGISSENLEQCLISLVDITTMKKVEQELIIATKKAEESDRLKSAFLANMSHEIRTPMNAIMGFSQLLNEDGIEPDEKKEFANIINKSGTHLLSLINDILEVAKIDSNQLKVTPTPFNLNRLIDELNLLYAREKEEKNKNHINLIITKSLKNENCNIFTDEVRLRQIFINLLSNALKFTNDGLIHFGYETKNDHILFFVKDTGKGIAKKNQEFIFERFRQEDDGNTRQYGGSGLGLSISKGLINIMDGTIWVESEENVGSTFYFTLPSSIITKEPIFSPKKINPAKVYNFEGKTVLIAEDVDDNMLLIRRNLRKTKATVIEVKNGVDAVKFCQENIQIDLVLMDILMPVMDGLDAAIEIRKTKPYLPIIAISAYAFDDDKDKSMNAGCNGFVTKPLNWTLLLEMIEGYLNK